MGWDYNPSVAVGDTSLYTREAVRPILMGWDFPLIRHAFITCGVPPSPKGRLITSEEGKNHSALCTVHCALKGIPPPLRGPPPFDKGGLLCIININYKINIDNFEEMLYNLLLQGNFERRENQR